MMNSARYSENRHKKYKSPAASDEGTAWLITYTDIITLVVTLFVVMLANSTIGKSLQSEDEITSRNIMDARGQQVQEIFIGGLSDVAHKYREDKAFEKWKQEKETIERLIRSAGISDKAQVSATASGITLRFEDNIFFASGTAELDDQGRDVLQKFMTVFQKPGLEVVVQGHTDNVPINTARFPSNWELSASRASEVARYLIEQGNDAERIHIEAYADNRPFASNADVAGRRQNRRVEIILRQAPEE